MEFPYLSDALDVNRLIQYFMILVQVALGRNLHMINNSALFIFDVKSACLDFRLSVPGLVSTSLKATKYKQTIHLWEVCII